MAGGKFGGGGYKVSGGLHGVRWIRLLMRYHQSLEVSGTQKREFISKVTLRGAVFKRMLKLVVITEHTVQTVHFLPDTEMF